MKWFRFYSEVLNDPKVQQLHPEDFRAWVNLLCLANETEPRGTLPWDDGQIGFALRCSAKKASDIRERLIDFGLIDVNRETFTLSMHNWDARQFESDDVTLRVTRHRQKGNVTSNVTRNGIETPPDTDTETESDPETEQTFFKKGQKPPNGRLERVSRFDKRAPDQRKPSTRFDSAEVAGGV